MKIPELKINEILLLSTSLEILHQKIRNDYLMTSKKMKRRMFFCPWEKEKISIQIIQIGEMTLSVLRDISVLHETLMESTGVDEDMRSITFRQMLNQGLDAR
jgi:hypothetical protein